jgi:hypothetical protein
MMNSPESARPDADNPSFEVHLLGQQWAVIEDGVHVAHFDRQSEALEYVRGRLDQARKEAVSPLDAVEIIDGSES